MRTNEVDKQKLEKQTAAVIGFLYWAILIAVVVMVVKYVIPAILPVIIAYFIAWILDRPIKFIAEKTHLPRGAVSGILVVLFICVGGSGLVLLGTKLISCSRDILTAFPEFVQQEIFPMFEEFSRSLEKMVSSVDPMIGTILETSMDGVFRSLNEGTMILCSRLLSALGGILTGIPSALIKTFIMIIACIFISADFKMVHDCVLRFIPRSWDPFLKESSIFFGKTLPRCLVSYAVILFVTFCELFAGFLLIRIPSAGLIAMIVALLDILPVLGTGTILIPWAVISIFQGALGRGVGLVLLYCIIAFIRNLIEPRLVGKQLELHPLLTLVGMLIGLRYFGLLGMLGVPLTFALLRRRRKQGVLHFPGLSPNVPEENKTPTKTI